MDYRASGVDVEAGRAFVQRIRSGVEATHRPEVVGGLGGFGGMIRLPQGLKRPLLVSGTDGVGTKLSAQHRNRRDRKRLIRTRTWLLRRHWVETWWKSATEHTHTQCEKQMPKPGQVRQAHVCAGGIPHEMLEMFH